MNSSGLSCLIALCPKLSMMQTLSSRGNQTRSYHKHKGYKADLLESRGQIITVCDRDAIFPPNFIESTIKSFGLANGERTVGSHASRVADKCRVPRESRKHRWP